MKEARQKHGLPSRRGYIMAAFLITFAIFGVPGFVIWFVSSQQKPTPFLAPGPLEFVAKEAGKHTLWQEYDTIFNGITYTSNALPGSLQLRCVDANSGVAVPFITDLGAFMSTANVKRKSVAAVQIPLPGKYLVSVEGATQSILFSFGPATLGKVLGSIFGAIPVAFILLAGGVALAIRVFVRRRSVEHTN